MSGADPAFLDRRRRALAGQSAWVGIDAVDVERAGEDVVLTLHLLGAAGALADASPALIEIAPPGLRPAAVGLEGDRLRVRLTGHGEPGIRHRVRLLGPDGRLDPFFAEAGFRLDVDATDVWSGAASSRGGRPLTPVPLVDYTARDFAGLRRLLLDRLEVLLPRRSEDHPADLLTTLVEVLAHVGDQLAYRQDAVATEAYLGTARRRVSVRRHARLLGYAMHEGCNARVWVDLELRPGSAPLTVPAGLRLLTRTSSADVTLAPDDPILRVEDPEVFETLEAARLTTARNALALHGWGARDLELPAGATEAWLRHDPADPADLAPGDVLLLEPTGQAAAPAHGVRLVSVDAFEDPIGADLTAAAAGAPRAQPLLRVRWHVEDALPTAVTVARGGRPVGVARANIVLADHGRTRAREPLLPLAGPRDRPPLTHGDPTYAAPFDPAVARTRPAADVFRYAPQDALPAIEVHEGPLAYAPRATLLGSGPGDRHFVAEHENDRATRLRFGDGRLGHAPTPGTRLSATYRVGNGLRGNIGPEALAHVLRDDRVDVTPVARVRNPRPASGGVDPEALEDARRQAPFALRRRSAAVVPADYAERAASFPGVARATAVQRAGRPAPIVVVVERRDRQPLSDAFRDGLREHLEPYRRMGHVVHVQEAAWLPLDLRLVAGASPGHRASTVRRALEQAFGAEWLPDGRAAFFHPSRFGFGDRVDEASIVAAARAVEGVAWTEVTLRALAGGPVTPGRLQIVRLDNDPRAPGNGILRIDVTGAR